MKGKILFVDDDTSKFTTYCIMQLKRQGFEVDSFLGNEAVAEALQFVESNKPHVDLGILDIMMPSGTRYDSEETEGGLNTGLFLYRDIRRRYPLLPIIMYSQVLDTGVGKLFPIESRLHLLAKNEHDVVSLAKAVENLVSRFPQQSLGTESNKSDPVLEGSDLNTIEFTATAVIEDVNEIEPLRCYKTYKLAVSIIASASDAINSSSIIIPRLKNETELTVTVFAQDFEIKPYWAQTITISDKSTSESVNFVIKPLSTGPKHIVIEFYHIGKWVSQVDFGNVIVDELP